MSPVFTLFTIVICLLVCPPVATGAHAAEAVSSGWQNQQQVVTIMPADPAAKQKTFQIVLLCDTPESRANGLQGFRQLKKDEAALFIFDEPQIATFWMGRVAFPIDIIFINADKKVITVYRDLTPGSRDLYPSAQQAKWVIETAAGSRIRAGDRVRIK